MLREVVMIAATACLMLGLAPGTAGAQTACAVNRNPHFGPYVQVKATTTTINTVVDGCAALRLENRTWLDGWTGYVHCAAGSYNGSGRCEAIGYGQAQVVSHLRMLSNCGPWGGLVEMLVKNRYNGSQLLQPVVTGSPLYGPTCVLVDENGCAPDEEWIEGVGCRPSGCPVIVPLTRSQAYRLTSVDNGVKFDWDGNGVPEQTAWTAADSRVAFLAIDMDGDGKITAGRELVGDQLVDGKENGWDALIALAPPNTTKLTEEHELFRRLLLWEDRNHDGVSQENELQPAGNVIAELGLGYIQHNRRDGNGNRFKFQGWASVRTAPGVNRTKSHEEMVERNIKIYDVFFRVQ